MSHQPSDGVQSPPFTRETSPDDAVFEETSLAEAAATALPSMQPPSSHSPEANTVRNSVERPRAPGVAPHVLPVTSKSSPASSSEISSRTTRHGEPSQASGKTTSQQKKRKYHLISREDDDDIKPYSFGKEPPRKKEIDHPSFKKAERAARNIPAEIISIIDQSSVTHGDIDFVKDIRNKAAAAMSPKATTGVKLGLRGDSGVGKSSVINSLLGVPNLAPQGDAGKACTSVVHEYHKPRVNQRNACEAEILFHTADARLKILKEWVECASTSDHSSGQLEDDRFEQEEKASETAIQGLFSLFRDRDECQDPGSIKKFVSTSKRENYEGLILKLTNWTEELLNDFEIVSGKISIAADTPQKLHAQMSRYTRHDSSIPSPWPLVDVARVFYGRPILSDDIILVDLPGTQDTNQFRVRTAMRYLNDVDFIGVVATSNRLQTDDNVRTYLRDAFRRKHRASTLLIATHSDSVDMSRTSLDDKINTADTVDEMNLTTLREQLDAASVKHQKITSELKEGHVRQDNDLLITLLDRQSELESRKKLLEENLFVYCVKMRNEDTTRSIRRNYSDWTNDPVELPVFCVSNLMYAKCTNNNGQPPMVDINNTNIPALRAFLYVLSALRKFKAFEHHHENVLPSLLNHLDITCSQTKIDGREELHKILLSASETVAGDVRKFFKKFFDEAILPGITIIKTNKAAYATYATEKLTKWSYWHNSTYKTFCIHRGNWRTETVGRRDWNEEMLELLVQDIDEETNGWEDAMGDLSENITAKLVAKITKLISEIHGADRSSTTSMNLFVLELERQQELLEESCKARVEKLQRDLIDVKERITDTQDMEESYFVRSLEKTYDDCSRMSGKGSHADRAEALRSKISHKVRDPFSEMFDLAKKDAQKVIQRHEKKFTQEVTNVFKNFNQTFAHGFMTEGADTTEVKQLRETLRAKIPHWREILTGEISQHVKRCREYAESGELTS